MSESLYNVKQLGQNSEKGDELSRVFDLESICRPRPIQLAAHFGTLKYRQVSSSGTESGASKDMTLSDHSMYIDSDISDELRLKVICRFRDLNNHSFFCVFHWILSTCWPG